MVKNPRSGIKPMTQALGVFPPLVMTIADVDEMVAIAGASVRQMELQRRSELRLHAAPNSSEPNRDCHRTHARCKSLRPASPNTSATMACLTRGTAEPPAPGAVNGLRWLLHDNRRGKFPHLLCRPGFYGMSFYGKMVEQRGIEPLTSALRTPRSPN